jgi:hypothetical protein
VNRQDGVNRLDLNDEPVVDHDVESIPTIERDVSIPYWHRHLRPERDLMSLQLGAEAALIHGFDQPRPERGMHVHRTADDALDEWMRLVRHGA